MRNLAIFTLVTISIGWLGWGLDVLLGNLPSQGPGQLIWLITPLGTSLLLRAFAGDGWRDFGLRPRLKKNAIWYAVSLGIFPLGAMVIISFGKVSEIRIVD